MSLIVVMEDDAATRALVVAVLKKDGYDVLSADNGEAGLALVRAHKPELVISDIQMPVMDGLAMLQALRSDPNIAIIPVILLTSSQTRAHMRIGMTSGADDFITKPFLPIELLEAVAAQLNRRVMHNLRQSMAIDNAVQQALEEQTYQLSALYEQRLARELSERWPTEGAAATDERFDSATLLYVDSPQFSVVSERLSSTELTAVIKKFYGRAGDTIHLFGARHMQFVGEGVLAVFVDSSDTQSVKHGLRAVRAALGLVESGRHINDYLRSRFKDRQLPAFEVNVALHDGPVTLTLLQDPLHDSPAQLLPIGDVVNTTLRMNHQPRPLNWGVTASLSMLRSVMGAVKFERRAVINITGHTKRLEVAEITGFSA